MNPFAFVRLMSRGWVRSAKVREEMGFFFFFKLCNLGWNVCKSGMFIKVEIVNSRRIFPSHTREEKKKERKKENNHKPVRVSH